MEGTILYAVAAVIFTVLVVLFFVIKERKRKEPIHSKGVKKRKPKIGDLVDVVKNNDSTVSEILVSYETLLKDYSIAKGSTLDANGKAYMSYIFHFCKNQKVSAKHIAKAVIDWQNRYPLFKEEIEHQSNYAVTLRSRQ